jgi:hypothetical protein
MVNRPYHLLYLVDVLLIMIKIALNRCHLLLDVADEVMLTLQVLLDHNLFYLVVEDTVTDRLLKELF